MTDTYLFNISSAFLGLTVKVKMDPANWPNCGLASGKTMSSFGGTLQQTC